MGVKDRNRTVFAPEHMMIPVISKKRTGLKRLQSDLNVTEIGAIQKIIWGKFW